MAREVGVSKHTIYAWKAKYGGMDVSQAQEAKRLRHENAKLRKLVADLSETAAKLYVATNLWGRCGRFSTAIYRVGWIEDDYRL